MAKLLQGHFQAFCYVFLILFVHAYAVNLKPIGITPIGITQRCMTQKKDTWPKDIIDNAVTTLPEFHIDTDKVIVTGFSSGADFAIQMQVAYSKSVKGMCAWSGQPYHCGVTRFPTDPLTDYNNENSIVSWGSSADMCMDCPPEKTLFADHCKGWKGADPTVVETNTLVNYAQNMSASGKIDPLENLIGRKIYLEHGGKDHVYYNGTLKNNAEFFNQLTNFSIDLRVERHYNIQHELPPHAVANCLTFQWPDLMEGSSPKEFHGTLRTFNQAEFFDEGVPTGLGSSGYYYAPKSCEDASHSPACRLVVWACGCGCYGVDVIMASGFLNWADSAQIVMIFPQTGEWSSDSCGFKQWQCFDAYGLSGADYALKSGRQMVAVMRMIARATGSKTLD